jgi:hypothetical protein
MTTPSAPAIRVFEPALCCNTGVCGPDVDQALVTFTADLDHLRGLGVDIQRHNLANDPAAFTAEPAVRDFLRVAGSAGLPLTLVDGITVATGAYPTRDRLLSLAHRAEDAEDDLSRRAGPTDSHHGAGRPRPHRSHLIDGVYLIGVYLTDLHGIRRVLRRRRVRW